MVFVSQHIHLPQHLKFMFKKPKQNQSQIRQSNRFKLARRIQGCAIICSVFERIFSTEQQCCLIFQKFSFNFCLIITLIASFFQPYLTLALKYLEIFLVMLF